MIELEKKSLHTLEYFKIIEMAKEFAKSDMAKGMLDETLPRKTLGEAMGAIAQTTAIRGIMDRRGLPPMARINDVTGIAKRAEIGSTLAPKELLQIGNMMRMCRNLRTYKEEDGVETEVDFLFFDLVPNRFLEDQIANAIISEEEIADSASSELRDIRRKIKNASAKVRETLNKLIHNQTFQKYLQDPIVSMRGERYVVPVKQEYRSQVPGLIHDTSSSGATIFVEPMGVVEANNELKVLEGAEKKEIERILRELSALVGENTNTIINNYTKAVHLDFLFAKGAFSRSIKGVEPKLNDIGKINIIKSRHPLLDPKTVVETDIYLGEEFDTLIITGPNTGGKTVALKTIGLFCAMGSAGFHIPAQNGSEVGVFDAIYADIGDEQSIEQSLSTFSSHMTNIVKISENLKENTLVLFDELGAGTDPVEGAALAIAIIDKMRSEGCKIAATTHYSELKIYALTTKGIENASCEFNVETLRPTYKLLIGVPGKSNAFAISQKLGLAPDIIEKAKEEVKKEHLVFEDILSDLETQRQEMERQKQKAEQYAAEIERLKTETQKERDHYKKTRENAIKQAKLEASRIVEGARFASEKVMAEIEVLRKEQVNAETQNKLANARSMIKGTLKKVDMRDSEGALKSLNTPYKKQAIKIGDTCMVLNLNRPATVATLPDKNGNMTVVAGVMKLSVNEKDIRITKEKVMDKKDSVASRYVSNSQRSTKTVKMELDLRGMDSEEGRSALEKYIDDAAMAGLHTVTIIHGKGTGVMRAMVHDYLRGCKCVIEYRLGRYGEGETGVTVVEIRG